MRFPLLSGAFLSATCLSVTAWSSVSAELPAELSAFLDQHCLECHDADVTKGGLDLTALKFELNQRANFSQWQRVFERVRDGEMPPKKQTQPEKPELAKFIAGLGQPLLKADTDDIATVGRVRSRKLTRTEYEHTLHDLLGIDIPVKALLPEDRASHGFETVAEGQQLSHHQLARYLDVADLALSEAFKRALEGDVVFERHCTPADLAMFTRGNYRGPDLKEGRSLSWPITLQFFGRMKATEVPEDGWYRITLRDVQAVNPGPTGAVWGTLRSGICYSNAPMLYMIGLVEATSTPRDLVYEAWIQKDHMLELKPNDATLKRAATGANGGNVSFKGRDLAKDGFSGISNRGIDLQRIYPNGDNDLVKRSLFGETDLQKAGKGDQAIKALDRLVARFARRAFRRPVTAEQTAPYQEIGRKVLAEESSLAEGLKASYRAILCSPRFLTFVEAPGELDDHAIASRLSYALWVSMPDAELLKLADQGKLKQPEVLSAQVTRLLADAKSQRFIESFSDQWLRLKEIDFTSPDTRQFPTFDPVVQESMLQETRTYLSELIHQNLDVTHLVDSDFAFLNGRLARHYLGDLPPNKKAELKSPKTKNKDKEKKQAKIAQKDATGVEWDDLMTSPLKVGEGLQKVSLNPQSMRGGLLAQGALLKVTSDGTSTSPVLRGVFVNERILGTHIPPPPPGVPAIEPDIRGATSIRERLEKHRSNESCMSCHTLIDPPGFALESFDPVGGWRTRYGKGKGAEVNPSGATPDGAVFADFEAWKQVYRQRADQLARGFAQQFLTYATGAAMRFSDAAALDTVVTRSRADGHGLRSILQAAVQSPVFLHK
ncbi:Planctomycete cytochrome C [Prosthecobacter debontii]|uniref:Planctomycete cytochrome C n=1 Tax=Prosthecobacter debontii TaxID=48467 RepID=A0A1T4Y3Z6_9BACT|nr:DUF1592 domain-containing protein [Prosthecobacter debontii]SKA96554.1 Planctomycete cytochrome C [Prosthecobacter debontii]